MEKILATVEELVFRRSDTSFTVADVVAEDGELITIVGTLPEIMPGESVELSGDWVVDQNFGKQFKVEQISRSFPETANRILKYLSGGAIKGLGPKTAQKIVNKYGDKTFEILENEPRKLTAIRGISIEKAEKWSEDFKLRFETHKTLMQLENMGFSVSESIKIYSAFGKASINIIRENPYILCTDTNLKIPFVQIEQLVQKLDNKIDDKYRMEAGIIHVLSHNILNGHTCIPREKLLAPCANLLNCSEDEIDICLDEMFENSKIKIYKRGNREYIFLPALYEAELKSAEKLNSLLKFNPRSIEINENTIKNLESKHGLKYDTEQIKAIKIAANKGLLILTGGPGTGKSTVLNAILDIYKEDGVDCVLAAPTGRAAKRLNEITSYPVKTIHRLLECEKLDEGDVYFNKNAQNPINAQAIIIDEVSMMDIYLFYSLLDAIGPSSRLILVGDSNQLPAVGPGNVLPDLIASDLMPVVVLDKIFRQAGESAIVENAHKIINGDTPEFNENSRDFFFMNREDELKIKQNITELYKSRLPKAYGFDMENDIQVLCATKKGVLGSINLNIVLREIANPPSDKKAEIRTQNGIFREGDKIMQIKNNYNIKWKSQNEKDKGIFNGDIGYIQKINKRAEKVLIDFDGKIAEYDFSGLSEIMHAYAITVHKSQGSEYESVIMPMLSIPYKLRYRNLLYTAVTRAKKIMILIGSMRIAEEMVKNESKNKRYSALSFFLEEGR
ncbi:MAG: ATP-dependent RecD-like DNA helicase [Clostridia bacterium]|nr:ATP-dependent RecD-like DNA helicase [Clostridia bacterium]